MSSEFASFWCVGVGKSRLLVVTGVREFSLPNTRIKLDIFTFISSGWTHTCAHILKGMALHARVNV